MKPDTKLLILVMLGSTILCADTTAGHTRQRRRDQKLDFHEEGDKYHSLKSHRVGPSRNARDLQSLANISTSYPDVNTTTPDPFDTWLEWFSWDLWNTWNQRKSENEWNSWKPWNDWRSWEKEDDSWHEWDTTVGSNSTGRTIGIVIGVVLMVIVILGPLCAISRKKRRQNRHDVQENRSQWTHQGQHARDAEFQRELQRTQLNRPYVMNVMPQQETTDSQHPPQAPEAMMYPVQDSTGAYPAPDMPRESDSSPPPYNEAIDSDVYTRVYPGMMSTVPHSQSVEGQGETSRHTEQAPSGDAVSEFIPPRYDQVVESTVDIPDYTSRTEDQQPPPYISCINQEHKTSDRTESRL